MTGVQTCALPIFGKVDLAKPLSTEISSSVKQLTIQKGDTTSLNVTISTNQNVEILTKATSEFSDITIKTPLSKISDSQTVPISISASESALPGTYKVIISARSSDVTVSEFITVKIIQ